jgi:hypothetical protein
VKRRRKLCAYSEEWQASFHERTQASERLFESVEGILVHDQSIGSPRSEKAFVKHRGVKWNLTWCSQTIWNRLKKLQLTSSTSFGFRDVCELVFMAYGFNQLIIMHIFDRKFHLWQLRIVKVLWNIQLVLSSRSIPVIIAQQSRRSFSQLGDIVKWKQRYHTEE